jgi:hypothetical protein
MTQITAVGDGPIIYFTDKGTQVLLPLSAILFEGNAIKTKPAAAPELQKWLDYLVDRGRISRGTAPTPEDAMVFTAAAAGSAGNDIAVRVATNLADSTKLDITATKTDVYEKLTVATISAVLGSSGAGGTAGTRPGMVRVQSIATGSPDPAEGPASPVTPPATPVAWTVPSAADATKPSFVLEARDPASDKGTMKITVSKVGTAGPKTFTLTVSWSSTATVGAGDLTLLPTDPASKFAALAFAVTVSKPPATALKLPRLGTFPLSGGAEPAVAKSAAATVQAST